MKRKVSREARTEAQLRKEGKESRPIVNLVFNFLKVISISTGGYTRD